MMGPLKRLTSRWPDVPAGAGVMAFVLLLVGVGVIFQNDIAYREQKLSETRVQAEILAASVTPALDFGDASTAEEAAAALGVNRQVNAAGIYTRDGTLFAGYQRERGLLPARLARIGARERNSVRAIVPVMRDQARIGSVYLATIQEPLTRRLTRYSVLALLVILAVMVVLVLGLAQAALRQANRELAERADALAAAYAALQVQTDERARAEEQLRQAQKMQSLGQLTGGIAHDFNNLLTVIQGSADMLGRPGLTEEKRKRFADAIVQTSARAAALTGQLLAFARRQPLRPSVVDLNRTITGMADLLDRTLGERVRVVIETRPDLCAAEVDGAQLESAILNIAVNARDAMPDGGTLTLRTAEAPPLADGRDAVSIAICDTGSGMAPDVLAQVFEPFFTTKEVGRGTGLGLSQVYGFAAQSGGDVSLSSAPGAGTTVTITLPCCESEGMAPAAASDEDARAHRTGRILVVDDNEDVGAFAESLLAELGHEVVRARSGEEALEIARRMSFDVLFTDVVMPGMRGTELAATMRETMPGVAVVLTTGYSNETAQAAVADLPVVFKPYRPETLSKALDEALGRNSG